MRSAESGVGDACSETAEQKGTVVLPDVADGEPESAPEPAMVEVAGLLPVDALPARMLNEFVYCPRLYFYEHVEGIFVDNADTLRGSAIHARVDAGKGGMPKGRGEGSSPSSAKVPGDGASPESAANGAGTTPLFEDTIHSRSVMLGSEKHGVVAKMDLVEVRVGADGAVASVCPVDYKVGSPRTGDDGANDLWDTDRMQLGLQCLVLRENGYQCDGGIIYYRGTKQRVPMEFTPGLEAWVLAKIEACRVVAKGPIPPPLVDSPKCVRCSLAPVCLPDETKLLALASNRQSPIVDSQAHGRMPDDVASGDLLSGIGNRLSPQPPRRLMAARDEKRVLFLNTQGFRVGCNDEVLKVKEKDRTVEEVRVSDVSQVVLFGNIQITTQTIQLLCEHDIPVTFFSMGGWFYGLARGHGMKNVLVRIAQFRASMDEAMCLRLARQFVRGKIHNHRVLFMRNHEQPSERVKLRLGQAREDLERAASLDELLGMEGAAAAEYFREFSGMLRNPEADDIPDVPIGPEAPWARFDFTTRNRRPPTDPVNALLSLAYSLLAKECTVAAYAVGLDPYVGFYHQPRHGRPALALDVMEEFRPLIAESAVLTAVNNRYVVPVDFVTAGRAVNLSQAGRRKFFQCFEQRMNSLVTHPLFDYKVSYRRAIELQMRILARVLTGEIPEYVPFLTR